MIAEYDPISDGVRVNIIEGAGNLSASIDALKVAIEANTAAISALIETM